MWALENFWVGKYLEVLGERIPAMYLFHLDVPLSFPFLSPVSHSSKVTEPEEGVMGTNLHSQLLRSTRDNLDSRSASEVVGTVLGN